MGLTSQQQQAAYAQGSVTITAGAGTGKTHMLAERYLFHLRSGFSPLAMVAMTFTDKAAAELRSRVRQTVMTQAPQEFDWLAELEAASIGTFHALAARICREHPEAAGVPADFLLLDAEEGKLWQREHLGKALAHLPPHLYTHVPYSLMRRAMELFLADPGSAQEALTRDRQDWLPVLQADQAHIVAALLGDHLWQESQAFLRHHSGRSGDKLEEVRQRALALTTQLEHHQHAIQGDAFQRALANWKSLTVGNVGSKKHWESQEILERVRKCVINWRDFTKNFANIDLLSLQCDALDDQAEALIPILRAAFEGVGSYLTKAKRSQRVLNFNDLEIHALQALAQPQVQAYYHQRWKVFLIDEFQDTNPTQGKLLEALTKDAILTLVGDEKQSIYGFRRADIAVFQTWRDRLSHTVPLTTSFRTHQGLIQSINRFFAPILAELHQDLDADRRVPPHPAPYVNIFAITCEVSPKPSLQQARQAEAQHIADLVETMLNDQLQVWDKKSHAHRPIQPGDIALLTRAWAPLAIYGQAISQRLFQHQPIPILQAGGGNLLETREAKDALALLQFLADPRDSVALVAVLRSPFFGLSDRLLLELRSASPSPWWQRLQEATETEARSVVDVLSKLLGQQRRSLDSPSRLLQYADRLTGYTAVIANLPGYQRRLADWQGFLHWVRHLEAGTADGGSVVRRLKRIVANALEIPRPPLEADNAVALMTIHAAKGLEWSVVIMPDLSRAPGTDSPLIRLDPQLGVALRPEDETGEHPKSCLYQLLEHRKKRQDGEEIKRLLYVAATRARDRLILTTPTTPKPGSGQHLWHGLQPALDHGFSVQEVLFEPENLRPFPLMDPPLPTLPRQFLLPCIGGGMELPITALTDYARCPKQFYYKYIEEHPGAKIGASTYGSEVGILTHKVLAQKITTRAALDQGASPLPAAKIEEAWDLAERFRHSPTYAHWQDGQWEQFLSLQRGTLWLRGLADLIGKDFILDIKTDQAVNPQEYRFQVWAYATAAQKPQAYLAYVRHDRLEFFSEFDLQKIEQSADALVTAIERQDYTATPSSPTCHYCAYANVCEQSVLGEARK